MKRGQNKNGFTIVELLIVIVVIAILASITIVAFNGIQQRARDSERKQDIATIAKALEMYYLDKGYFPTGSGSTSINASWSTTADSSWSTLETKLQPYLPKLPTDPISKPMGVGAYPWNDPAGYDYSYVANGGCRATNAPNEQTYIIVYKFESGSQTNTLIGDCPANPLGTYAGSNYRVVK